MLAPNEFYVEKILKKRTTGLITEYLVKWEGYSQLVVFYSFVFVKKILKTKFGVMLIFHNLI